MDGSRSLKPGDRVRCIDAAFSGSTLTHGAEYKISYVDGELVMLCDCEPSPPLIGWHYSRFKPVVRVKAWRRRVRFTELGITVISELGGGQFYDEWLDRGSKWLDRGPKGKFGETEDEHRRAEYIFGPSQTGKV
jgi:hypothetical protein